MLEVPASTDLADELNKLAKPEANVVDKLKRKLSK